MPDILGSIEYTWPFYGGFIIAYLLGSIPFGLLFTRIGGLGDVREIGSGNIGATNVLRTGNKFLAALTLIFDAGKGIVAVAIASVFGPDMVAFASLAVVLGHLFPIWLKFRGGKGVATTFGVLVAISWPAGLLACLTWIVSTIVFRISSVSALVALAASPIFIWWFTDSQRVEISAALALIVWIRHWSNIRRLFNGKEPRISFKF